MTLNHGFFLKDVYQLVSKIRELMKDKNIHSLIFFV